ncbi:MAG TPA: nucleoside triphosphate pyrophosphohydrolase [Candidatus Paceibacterota bacterium]
MQKGNKRTKPRGSGKRRAVIVCKNYGKLIRDGIPDELTAKGLSVRTKTVRGRRHVDSLVLKLTEEADELKGAIRAGKPKRGDIVGEMGDLSQVLRDLAHVLGIPWREVKLARRAKFKRRGGFAGGTFLLSVGTPKK